MKEIIKLALEDLKNGKPIIVVDDEDRENEGDIVLSAEKASTENLIFSILNARGLMCLPHSKQALEHLDIPMMVEESTCKLQTPFTVSVDGIKDVTTGMSVYDRLQTISVLLDQDAKPTDLARPGHLFPLLARENLLLDRRGHTEASVELMKLAGLKELAIIVEIMSDDGTMTKGTELKEYAEKHDLLIITIEDIYDTVYNS